MGAGDRPTVEWAHPIFNFKQCTRVWNMIYQPCEAKKTAPFYFCNSLSIKTILAHVYYN